ncbi:MAG: hypothetical protein HYV94_10690 [Candidatus Rokubacteria bacterium]|nr:hypothetical protein [Candidatus Rokubacteria bacterium]
MPLGSYAHVHRGVATGANDFFILSRDEARIRGLERHTRPCLVRAAEVITAGGVVRAGKLDHVLLDTGIGANDAALHAYVKEGQRRGAHQRYLCSHRKPWWRVGGSPPPPIVATYMARQAPVFAVNPERCQIVNVFHGIHFREAVDESIVWALTDWLNANRETLLGGRTYQGGLRKFEPADLEAILVPPPHRLCCSE